MRPHHENLHHAIRALQNGDVDSLDGRMRCIEAVRSAITERHAYWASNPIDYETYKAEDIAFNMDLLSFFIVMVRRLNRVERELTEQQMINTVLSRPTTQE